MPEGWFYVERQGNPGHGIQHRGGCQDLHHRWLSPGCQGRLIKSILTLGKVRMNSVHSGGRAKFRIVFLTYTRSVRLKDIFLFRRHLKVLYS